MHPYHHAIKEEKLLSSKKVTSFLQRRWKGVIPPITSIEVTMTDMSNWFRQDAESQGFAVFEGLITNVCDGGRKTACIARNKREVTRKAL